LSSRKFRQELVVQTHSFFNLAVFDAGSAGLLFDPTAKQNDHYRTRPWNHAAEAVKAMIVFLELPQRLTPAVQGSEPLVIDIGRSHFGERVELAADLLAHLAVETVEEVICGTAIACPYVLDDAGEGSGHVYA